MIELSSYGKIFLALELAKDAGIGCEFTNLEVIELLGHIRSMSETVGLDRQRIAELEAKIIEAMKADANTRELLKWLFAQQLTDDGLSVIFPKDEFLAVVANLNQEVRE